MFLLKSVNKYLKLVIVTLGLVSPILSNAAPDDITNNTLIKWNNDYVGFNNLVHTELKNILLTFFHLSPGDPIIDSYDNYDSFMCFYNDFIGEKCSQNLWSQNCPEDALKILKNNSSSRSERCMRQGYAFDVVRFCRRDCLGLFIKIAEIFLEKDYNYSNELEDFFMKLKRAAQNSEFREIMEHFLMITEERLFFDRSNGGKDCHNALSAICWALLDLISPMFDLKNTQSLLDRNKVVPILSAYKLVPILSAYKYQLKLDSKKINFPPALDLVQFLLNRKPIQEIIDENKIKFPLNANTIKYLCNNTEPKLSQYKLLRLIIMGDALFNSETGYSR